MTNWHLISVPSGWTECERYGNAIIAVKDGQYCGFAVRYATYMHETRADVRRAIDQALAEKL